jgi:hypothetical protein
MLNYICGYTVMNQVLNFRQYLRTSTTGHIFNFSLRYHFYLYIHKKSSQL